MLEGLTPPPKIKPCRIRDLAVQLGDKDGKILLDAVADSQLWTINGLVSALSERGVSVSSDAVNRHRKGLCSCSTIN